MKAAVFYYSQSGQALKAAESICGSMSAVYKEITPQHNYPFPWSRKEFFQVFPETRLGIPPSGIEPLDFSDIADADIVIISGQSWFLSPSLPLQSFFSDEKVKEYLKGRNIVFVNSCRNMWLMTSRKVKEYIKQAGAYRPAGQGLQPGKRRYHNTLADEGEERGYEDSSCRRSE